MDEGGVEKHIFCLFGLMEVTPSWIWTASAITAPELTLLLNPGT